MKATLFDLRRRQEAQTGGDRPFGQRRGQRGLRLRFKDSVK